MILNRKVKGKVTLRDAVCLVFEGIKSMRFRVPMMVALGHDIYYPGILHNCMTNLKRDMDKLRADMDEDKW